MTDWAPLHKELEIWRSEGRRLRYWWRDDDAVTETPALQRLIGVAQARSLPCHLAVIPKNADDTLVQVCQTTEALVPLVHGWSHENQSPAGQKKAEFGHARQALSTDAARGFARMEALFADDFVPCFVPPWNRISPTLVTELPALGYNILSTYAPRLMAEAAPGLRQINTHIDPINWRGGGGLLPLDFLIKHTSDLLEKRRKGLCDATEALGILTHHLVHDEDIWRFTETLIARLNDAGGVAIHLNDEI